MDLKKWQDFWSVPPDKHCKVQVVKFAAPAPELPMSKTTMNNMAQPICSKPHKTRTHTHIQSTHTHTHLVTHANEVFIFDSSKTMTGTKWWWWLERIKHFFLLITHKKSKFSSPLMFLFTMWSSLLGKVTDTKVTFLSYASSSCKSRMYWKHYCNTKLQIWNVWEDLIPKNASIMTRECLPRIPS